MLPEEKLSAARTRILQSCDLVIDIGAHNGQWLANVREKGFKGAAICIEPSKKNYIELKKRNLYNTKTFNYAIGNKKGFKYLNEASNDGLSSSILEMDKHHILAAPDIKYLSKEKVNIRKLSEIIKNCNRKKIYIKIDTQGFEFQILKSIAKQNYKYIFGFEIETNLVSTYKNLSLVEEIISYLRERGYKPFRMENGFGMPNFGQQLQVDIIFLKDEIINFKV